MILRLWRGRTTPKNADCYEELITTAIFPGIIKRATTGLDGLELFRRPVDGDVEFMTLMRFASWEAVKAFAGPDWEVSVVRRPPAQCLHASMKGRRTMRRGSASRSPRFNRRALPPRSRSPAIGAKGARSAEALRLTAPTRGAFASKVDDEAQFALNGCVFSRVQHGSFILSYGSKLRL